MIEFTKKDVRDMLREELRRYKATIGRLEPDERKELREWVAAGNSVHCNPYYLAGEDGAPLDYITAIRIAEDMWCDPEDYHTAPEPGLCADIEDDELPF